MPKKKNNNTKKKKKITIQIKFNLNNFFRYLNCVLLKDDAFVKKKKKPE